MQALERSLVDAPLLAEGLEPRDELRLELLEVAARDHRDRGAVEQACEDVEHPWVDG